MNRARSDIIPEIKKKKSSFVLNNTIRKYDQHTIRANNAERTIITLHRRQKLILIKCDTKIYLNYEGNFICLEKIE